jgi:tellurite resistance protein TerC
MEQGWVWWVGFNIFVLTMLAVDLGVFHRRSHEVKLREAVAWSVVWIVLALVFNAGIYFGWFGTYAAADRPERAFEFLTGYVIEKSLSVDNIFVFLLIFSYFRVPAAYQHKVLFWGILGALIMRAVFIFTGIALIEKFHWIIYLFGAFLVITGLKMAWAKDKEIHPEHNPILRLFRRLVPVTVDYVEERFFVRRGTEHLATPLFATLLLVETTDLIFAVDSIPAILAVTRDPFIVYTSNVFAILGLRALYFALAGIMGLFYYLHYGLAAVLIFVGGKMLVSGFYKVPILVSLGVIAGILTISIVVSLLRASNNRSLEMPTKING